MALALLTDLYQFTMAYGYWRSGRHRDTAQFELFFREAPFRGGFALFFGLEESVRFLREFKFSQDDITYLESVLPSTVEKGFLEYLQTVDASEVTVSSLPEGSVVFAREPLMKVRGPLLVVQLLETTLLCLVNYASLVGTNAARFRLAASPDKKLVEMGLRRAQGRDGGLSASKYSYMGGFDCTSNVLAGKLFGVPVAGSVAHSFVSSFSCTDDMKCRTLRPANKQEAEVDFLSLSRSWLGKVCRTLKIPQEETNVGELSAFVSYAIAYPLNFLTVVDTYSVLMSGVPNFCAVALALHELGYHPIGVRLDSGDLASQSVKIRKIFQVCAKQFEIPDFENLSIVVSNNISEESLKHLTQNTNEINMVGVGTHLVTCTLQPSLGCVYKLVQVNDTPCMKMSEDEDKMTIPGSKIVYRLYDGAGQPLLDLMALEDEPPPEAEKEVKVYRLGKNTETERVASARVERLHHLVFKNGQLPNGQSLPSIHEIRSHAQRSLHALGQDHRKLENPKPYTVAMTEKLHCLLTSLRKTNFPG
ncbi:nicotinate phosphoribosyltransferase [Spea bombifrons]|uniref:nicotinate phosphoribosyltransferase n=1 Tax=Spea bombifrons TaxID=233779 RepID=UPI00234B78B1|nr:nicotinate phosphoribosyltransferase [Spea bombifrons]